MRTTHASNDHKSRSSNVFNTISGSEERGWKHGAGEALKFAPSKFNCGKQKEVADKTLEYEDAIPAATYESSDSSDEFQVQVERVLEGDAESSKRNEKMASKM
jgi:hypothetical protein